MNGLAGMSRTQEGHGMALIQATSRSEPTNHNCPKCGGHIWWDDTIERFSPRGRGRVRRWWWWKQHWDHCPETEHLHRSDRCVNCQWGQTRVETIEGETLREMNGMLPFIRPNSRWNRAGQ